MVDIVTNHMGYYGCGNCVDYSKYDAFPDVRHYPFHHRLLFCVLNYHSVFLLP